MFDTSMLENTLTFEQLDKEKRKCDFQNRQTSTFALKMNLCIF